MARVSMKAYMVQAIWNWCNDYGFSPYIMVRVDDACTVPNDFVENGRIIFDISDEATGLLDFADEAVRFEARFGDVPMTCYVPYRNILAAYPAEAPQKGMMFSPEMDEEEEISPETTTPSFSRVK